MRRGWKRCLGLAAAVALTIGMCVSGWTVVEAEAAETETVEMQGVSDPHRVFYEIFVGSFSDSNGDGIGDLRGIINRLDYLNDGHPESASSLDVEGIWLTPVFVSPSYHKYDAADYYEIDPAFGTEKDLEELIDLCHERGMLVILDLALNHTSDRNVWYREFLEAHKAGHTEDPLYDWYVWLKPGDEVPAGRRFMSVEEAGILVEANFSDHMPELNYDQEPVRQAALDIAKHYLALGVDGFRFDAAKYIDLGNHEKSVAFWDWYMDELRKIKPDLYAVAEVWDGDGVVNRYLPSMNCFHFSTSQAEGIFAETAKGGDVNRFVSSMQACLEEIHAINPEAMNIAFLSNHDMDRSAGYLTMASGRAHMAANLYLLSPGSPFIYYGEEIGLRGSRGGASTDANRRLAMLWGDGDPVQDPEGSTYTKQSTYTVKDLDSMGGSLLNHYRKVMKVRRDYPEIARGTFQALSFEGTKAGGFLATMGDSIVGVFHNTTDREQRLDLKAAGAAGLTEIRAVLSADPLEGGAELEDGILTLGPQTSAVVKCLSFGDFQSGLITDPE